MADKKIYVGEEGAKELYRRNRENLASAVETINGELELKATKEELGEAVETIDGKLDGKASQTALDTAVSDINTELTKKAVKTEVDAEISRIDGVLADKANTSDVNDALSLKENLSNKVTAFNEPTDTQYPSAALVHAEIVRLEGIIGNLGGFEKANLTSDVPPVPSSTSSDADKVLTVNSSGSPEWKSQRIPVVSSSAQDDTVSGTELTSVVHPYTYKEITVTDTITKLIVQIEDVVSGVLQEAAFQFTLGSSSVLADFEVHRGAYVLPAVGADTFTAGKTYQGTVVNGLVTLAEFGAATAIPST